MDVTNQILAHNNIYGASDYTGAHTLSASRSLNYAEGGSITKPQVETLNVIPFTFKYQDAVGLFGAENFFVRVDIDVDRDFSKGCFEEPWYECAEINEDNRPELSYQTGDIDYRDDLTPVNTFDPAKILPNGKVPLIYDPYISVNLNNLKVNNQYIDEWLDVTLYDSDRQEVAGDFMYTRLRSHFYIGFHARNTRRLPYNVELTVGEELRSGLPSTECFDDWELSVDPCGCVEEKDWVCGKMTLYKEVGTYVSADVLVNQDSTTVNSFQPARLFLQPNECITNSLADFLNLARRSGRTAEVPPPKTHLKTMRKDHRSDPCCASCH